VKKFDGILICTDLDGTLLNSDRKVSEENRRAIAEFQREGGLFTFITGRMPFFVGHIWDAVRPNAPIGCVNGAGLYDYAAQKYIWTAQMPAGVEKLIRSAEEKFPSIGIQVNTYDKTYFCRENPVMVHFRKSTGLPNLVRGYTEVEEPIAKIVFGCETEEEIRGLEALLRAHPNAGAFDFVRSEQTLFEILPPGISKGTSIHRLCECLGLDIARTVALGDYNNDIPMFRAAKLGIAVANACPDALAAADSVTVSNDEHAIARVIGDLASGKLIL